MFIAQSLKVKADEVEVLKKELEGTQAAFLGYKEARKREDIRVKELVEEIKAKNVQAADDARKLRAENERLKKELDNRPSEEEVLSRFRGMPA